MFLAGSSVKSLIPVSEIVRMASARASLIRRINGVVPIAAYQQALQRVSSLAGTYPQLGCVVNKAQQQSERAYKRSLERLHALENSFNRVKDAIVKIQADSYLSAEQRQEKLEKKYRKVVEFLSKIFQETALSYSFQDDEQLGRLVESLKIQEMPRPVTYDDHMRWEQAKIKIAQRRHYLIRMGLPSLLTRVRCYIKSLSTP